MKIHVFNPDHDLALAADNFAYVAPHTVRRLRDDIGFMPALWSDDGDIVLVDNVDRATQDMRLFNNRVRNVVFMTANDLSDFLRTQLDDAIAAISVDPWGWNKVLIHRLGNVCPQLTPTFPSPGQMADIRRMSNRRFAATYLLPALVREHPLCIGTSYFFDGDIDELAERMNASTCALVIKAPWSGAGRGMHLLHGYIPDGVRQWTAKVIARQGGVMVEPFYKKIKDFGMEFHSDGADIHFLGLSLFYTKKNHYAGNLLAPESVKRNILSQYMPEGLIESIAERIITLLSPLMRDRYHGPFGVDMMIVRDEREDSYRIQPCVELNLRRTMGHAALALSAILVKPQQLTLDRFFDKFLLRVTPLSDVSINTLIPD